MSNFTNYAGAFGELNEVIDYRKNEHKTHFIFNRRMSYYDLCCNKASSISLKIKVDFRADTLQ